MEVWARLYLDVDEGREVKLMLGPLAHKELVAFLPRQRVEELQETETTG